MSSPKARLAPAILLLLSACATVPPAGNPPLSPPAPAAPAPVPPAEPSRLGMLDTTTGYVGDCFAGFFRRDMTTRPDGSWAWILIDPFDGTGEVQFEGRHLILKRTDNSGDSGKVGDKVHSHYRGTKPDLDIDLDYTDMDIDPDGLIHLEGDITLSSGGRSEKVHVQGHAAC